MGLAQAGVGALHLYPCSGTPASDTQEPPSPILPVLYPSPPPWQAQCWSAPARHRPGETGGGGALIGTHTQCLDLAEGWQGLLDHSSYGFGAQPEKGGGMRRGVGGRAGGSFCGSVCGKVFFFPFFPFFLSKKCTKARQPLCNGQQCFLRVGLAGRGPRAWHPACD